MEREPISVLPISRSSIWELEMQSCGAGFRVSGSGQRDKSGPGPILERRKTGHYPNLGKETASRSDPQETPDTDTIIKKTGPGSNSRENPNSYLNYKDPVSDTTT